MLGHSSSWVIDDVSHAGLMGVWGCPKEAWRCVKSRHTFKMPQRCPEVDWIELSSSEPAPWAPLLPWLLLTAKVQEAQPQHVLLLGWEQRVDISPALSSSHPTQPKQRPLILLMCLKQRRAGYHQLEGPAVPPRVAASGTGVWMTWTMWVWRSVKFMLKSSGELLPPSFHGWGCQSPPGAPHAAVPC